MKMANSRQRTTMLLMNAKRIANGKLNLGRVFPVQVRLLLPEKMSNDPIFRVVENSYFNRSLRSAAQKLGLSKYIHCHLARHTFATTCITLGIPLPATSKLLGHRNLETTLIYAKFVDPFLDKEMRKFNKL